MTDPTEGENAFLRKLELRAGKLVLQGNLSLLNIDRLIPDYVTREITSVDTAVFTSNVPCQDGQIFADWSDWTP
jgi:hypothetical protein